MSLTDTSLAMFLSELGILALATSIGGLTQAAMLMSSFTRQVYPEHVMSILPFVETVIIIADFC